MPTSSSSPPSAEHQPQPAQQQRESQASRPESTSSSSVRNSPTTSTPIAPVNLPLQQAVTSNSANGDYDALDYRCFNNQSKGDHDEVRTYSLILIH